MLISCGRRQRRRRRLRGGAREVHAVEIDPEILRLAELHRNAPTPMRA